ncbi:MAG: BMP family protein [Candidatus Bipolaricaulia bacterium]
MNNRKVVKTLALAWVVVLIGLVLLAVPGASAESKGEIVIVTLPPGRGDLGFTDLSFKGAEQAAQDFGLEVRHVLADTPADMVPTLSVVARRPNVKLIIGPDFDWLTPITTLAPRFPDKNFLLIDIAPEQFIPNVLGVVYEQHKGSALVGALAALLAIHYDQPHVGVVFGVPIAVLWNFEIGYKWGVDWGIQWYKFHFPDQFAAEPMTSIVHTPRNQRVLWEYTNTWTSTAAGDVSATAMFEEGAVAVYNVAGSTGLGINTALERIRDERGLEMGPPFGIGVDANQDWITPGFVIASMLKRVDRSVYEAVRLVVEGKFKDVVTSEAGQAVLGIGTMLGGKPVTGIEVSDLSQLDEFIEFGKQAEALQGRRILPASPSEIRSQVKEMREGQPAWIWDAVAELASQIEAGEVAVPNVWNRPDLDRWRDIYG